MGKSLDRYIYPWMYSIDMNKKQRRKLLERGLEYVKIVFGDEKEGEVALWRIDYDEGEAKYVQDMWDAAEYMGYTTYDGFIGDYLEELGLEELKEEYGDRFSFKPIE